MNFMDVSRRVQLFYRGRHLTLPFSTNNHAIPFLSSTLPRLQRRPTHKRDGQDLDAEHDSMSLVHLEAISVFENFYSGQSILAPSWFPPGKDNRG